MCSVTHTGIWTVKSRWSSVLLPVASPVQLIQIAQRPLQFLSLIKQKTTISGCSFQNKSRLLGTILRILKLQMKWPPPCIFFVQISHYRVTCSACLGSPNCLRAPDRSRKSSRFTVCMYAQYVQGYAPLNYYINWHWNDQVLHSYLYLGPHLKQGCYVKKTALIPSLFKI